MTLPFINLLSRYFKLLTMIDDETPNKDERGILILAEFQPENS